MIDYDMLNEYFLHERHERLMVVYKEGSVSQAELYRRQKHLKAYYFVSDKQELRMTICGIQFSGVIIEAGADLTYENFRYSMSRMRSRDDYLFFMMDDKHKERLEDIMEEFIESSNNKETMQEFKDSIRFMVFEEKEKNECQH